MDCFKICRLCMENCGDEYIPIYNEFDGNLLVSIIIECAQIEIFEDDMLPKNSCRKCAESMNVAFNIIQRCRKSDVTLRSILKTDDFDNVLNNPNLNGVKMEGLSVSEYEILLSETIEYDEMLESAKIEYADFSGTNKILEDGLAIRENNVEEHLDVPEEKSEIPEQEFDENQTEYYEIEEDQTLQTTEIQLKIVKKFRRKCCGCKKEFENDLKLLEHSKLEHFGDRVENGHKQFECTVCFKRFLNETLLKEHNRIIYRKYFCPICGKKLMTRANLNNHMKNHPRKTIQKCCGCRQDFESEKELSQHSELVHKPHKTDDRNKPHECEICFRRYPTRKSLVTHKRLVRQHQCDTCGQIFMKKTFLATHILTHQKENPIKKKCCGCREEFDTSKELKLHSESIHRNLEQHEDASKPFVCDICFKRVASKVYLAQHKRKVYNEKVFQCPTCGRSFSRPHDLSNHELTHSEDTPYECSVCFRQFKTKVYLKNHFKLHTDTEKKHVCDECEKAFRTKDLLKTHLVGHSDERKFQCSACPSSFKRLYCLKSHMRVHTREKAFGCNLCSKKYVQSTDLKRHMLTHSSGDSSKPFQCHFCLRRYPRKDYLKIHIAKQHTALQIIELNDNVQNQNFTEEDVNSLLQSVNVDTFTTTIS